MSRTPDVEEQLSGLDSVEEEMQKDDYDSVCWKRFPVDNGNILSVRPIASLPQPPCTTFHRVFEESRGMLARR